MGPFLVHYWGQRLVSDNIRTMSRVQELDLGHFGWPELFLAILGVNGIFLAHYDGLVTSFGQCKTYD